jgi:disulfide bond formation protein DsbB
MATNIERPDQGTWGLLLAAWITALISTLGSLFIGEIMGQAPCVVCWFQRVFMFPLAIILAIACIYSDFGVWRYAMSMAVVGLLLASYHSLLYGGVIPERLEPCGAGPSCSSGDMSIIGVPIPLLSVAAFAVLIILLVLIRRRSAT